MILPYRDLWILSTLCLSVGFLVVSGVPLEAESGDASRRFSVSGTPTVHIENGSGDIRVRKGPAGVIKVSMLQSGRGVKPNYGYDVLNNLTLIIKASPADTCSLGLTVPADCNIVITTRSGTVDIEAVNGTHQVRSETGDIKLSLLRGSLRLSAGSGDILLKGIGRSDIEASSQSGSINYSQGRLAGGAYVFSTAEGDINIFHFKDASYTIEGKSAQGEITSMVDGLDVLETAGGTGMSISGKQNAGTSAVRIESNEGYLMIGLDTTDPPSVGEIDPRTRHAEYIKSLNFNVHGKGCPCHSFKNPTLETGF